VSELGTWRLDQDSDKFFLVESRRIGTSVEASGRGGVGISRLGFGPTASRSRWSGTCSRGTTHFLDGERGLCERCIRKSGGMMGESKSGDPDNRAAVSGMLRRVPGEGEWVEDGRRAGVNGDVHRSFLNVPRGLDRPAAAV
jgi:hypothetical protein